MDTQITKFMGLKLGPPGSCRPQMGPMLAPWTLLSGYIIRQIIKQIFQFFRGSRTTLAVAFIFIALLVLSRRYHSMELMTHNPFHDDVIKWKHFPRYWPFVRGIHRSPVNSPHKGQWRGALMFSLIYAWMNCWVNNLEAGDLRRYRVHYDVTVMDFLNQLPQYKYIY